MDGAALGALAMGVGGSGALAEVVGGEDGAAVGAGAHAEADLAWMAAVVVVAVVVCSLVEVDHAPMVDLVLGATLVALGAILVVLGAIPQLGGVPHAAFREASREAFHAASHVALLAQRNPPTAHHEAHALALAWSLQ